ncbi:MAG: hypothetical protein IGQ88_04350 [Gloeomargaritaceae cyanobacterium C42_A2020_066]|nr:hypothetical protein [Gloeomargaritaceae cyanobacterium C42_A2020_066]
MPPAGRATPSPKPDYPLDRVARGVIAVLTVILVLLLVGGDRSQPQVRQFTWADRTLSAQDRAFILTFNRPMQQASVTDNLKITPPLPGRASWAGRRMAYTLSQPVPYGQRFTLSLQGGRDQFGRQPRLMRPFQADFRSRDRVLIYLGTQGSEAGRLVLHNLTNPTHTVLTPPDLTILDFQPFPQGDRILFSAQPATGDPLAPPLYTVTTGLDYPPPVSLPGAPQLPAPRPGPAGRVDILLDDPTYQNLKFDLSADGQTILVARASRRDPQDTGLWRLTPQGDLQRLNLPMGGDFLITPDGQSLVMAQGEGVALFPLQTGNEPLDFLPKFGQVLAFDPLGNEAALIKFNSDFTRSLYRVTNQGQEQELLRVQGSILSALFHPGRPVLYVLLAQARPERAYQELPTLGAINLETRAFTPLLSFASPQLPHVSLAADGSALLFDQPGDTPDAPAGLWLYPLGEAMNPPQSLGLKGQRPQWLP